MSAIFVAFVRRFVARLRGPGATDREDMDRIVERALVRERTRELLRRANSK